MTHALWGMLSFLHSLAFLCGRVKIISISYVWTRIFSKPEEKILRFQKYPDTCGRGLKPLALARIVVICFDLSTSRFLFDTSIILVRAPVQILGKLGSDNGNANGIVAVNTVCILSNFVRLIPSCLVTLK